MPQFDYRNKWKPTLYYCLLYAVVVWVFLHKFNLYVLNPECISWLMYPGSDCITDMTTWEYYRYAATINQLGVFNNYCWPQAVGVGNTSIVPLFAIPLKWIQQFLPESFQYFGWFLFVSYLLQAYFADRLLKLFQIPIGVLRFSGSICLTLAPVLLFRAAHISLCAHWIILACLCFYFDKQLNFTKKWCLLH